MWQKRQGQNDMKNKNCDKFYRNVKILFPKVDFKEGRFLRDLKKQIEEYAIRFPTATYEDVEEAFGSPEDIIYDFFSLTGTPKIARSVKKRWIKKLTVIIVASILAFLFCSYCLLWYVSYRKYTESLIDVKETIIYEGEKSYE